MHQSKVKILQLCLTGLLIYFLYGIHYSKEAVVDPSSYAVLMESSEAERGAKWGSTLKLNRKNDASDIIESEEYLH